jgi:hypothetical protein
MTGDTSEKCPVCKMSDFTSLSADGARREREIHQLKKSQGLATKPHTNIRRTRYGLVSRGNTALRSLFLFAASTLVLSVVLNSTIWSSPGNPLDIRTWLQGDNPISSSAEGILDAGADFLDSPGPKRLLPTVGYNGNGQFRFLSYDSEGNPTGFHSPCEPIRYEVNPANEPEGAREVLEAAIQSMRYYTGLQFEFVGDTDELIQHNEPIPVVNPPSTLLINYYPTEVMEDLPKHEDYEHVENVAGWGGPRSYQDLIPGKQQYRALGGVMALDADFIAEDVSQGLWGEPRGRTTFALMIHELAHVVGLDHVDSKSEIMHFDAIEGVWEFQGGDQEGLSIAGQGACGSDALGNLVFGEELSEVGTNVSATCVVDELKDTHEMFELRQEGNVDDRPCALNPFPQAGQERGLQVNFRWTSQSPEIFLSRELDRFEVGDRPDPLFEQREFRGVLCNVMAIYSPEGDPIPLYWLYVVCGEKVAVVVGENFSPTRYFESPILQAIVEHSRKSP